MVWKTIAFSSRAGQDFSALPADLQTRRSSPAGKQFGTIHTGRLPNQMKPLRTFPGPRGFFFAPSVRLFEFTAGASGPGSPLAEFENRRQRQPSHSRANQLPHRTPVPPKIRAGQLFRTYKSTRRGSNRSSVSRGSPTTLLRLPWSSQI